jgi:transposase
MAKRKFNLTESEMRQLQAAFQQEKDGPTRTRYQAVRLYGAGTAVADIQGLTGCARSSLMEWVQKYVQDGLEGLQDHRGGPHASKLTRSQITELREKLLQYTPYNVLGPHAHTLSGVHWTVPDLYSVVKQWYGVCYQSRTSYLSLFVACGFSYQWTEKVFKSRREAQVLEFEADTEKN